MADKTIKELAEELGVSKTAINKKVSDKNRKLWFAKNGNKFVINETGQKAIKSMFLVDNANLNRKLVGEKSKTKNHKNTNQVSELNGASWTKHGSKPGQAVANLWDKNKNGWIGFYYQRGYDGAGRVGVTRYKTL